MPQSGGQSLFWMMNVRSADQSRVIDPSRDVARHRRADLSDVLSVRLLRPSDQVMAQVRGWQPLTPAEFTESTPWASDGSAALTEKTVRAQLKAAGHPDAEEYVATGSFWVDYAAVVRSWLVLKAQGLIGLKGDLATIAAHQDAIRGGHLLASGFAGRSLAAIESRPVVLPEQWLDPSLLAADRPSSSVSANGTDVAELRARHRALSGTIRTLDRLRVQGARIGDSLERDDSGRVPKLSDSFFVALRSRFAGEDLTTVDMMIDARPGTLQEFHDNAQVATDDLTAEGNALCRTIRVFEEERRQRLPGARTATSDARPAIRTLGWGDLLVARETLEGYTTTEISHIENVLPGETKNREHERSLSQEVFTESEEFEETFSERDLETSERFELQSEASSTINTEFTTDAAVNTSGKYGLTTVNTSVDVGYGNETQQAQRTALSTAQSVTTRSVERVQKSLRKVRRATTIETVRETTGHLLDNSEPGAAGVSGVYEWLDKRVTVQLHHYGKRLLVEFTVPEPGVSLIESASREVPAQPKPAPLAIGPDDVTAANYLCLTELYGARDVEPPPAPVIQVGTAFATEIKSSETGRNAESTMAEYAKVPPGYSVISGRYAATGRGTNVDGSSDPLHAHIAVGGEPVLDSAFDPASPDTVPTPLSSYAGSFELTSPSQAGDEGVPITGRLSGHDDRTGTINVYLTCTRSNAALQAWQLDTYERLKEAHTVLVEQFEQALTQLSFAQDERAPLGLRPSSVNREIERRELTKWAIKLMRSFPYAFDPVVDEQGMQEVDPVAADEQAGIVRFFEESFEWDQMSYFLHPYFWGRRSAWRLRLGLEVPHDPVHEAFLKAGSARVVVPVTPGSEDRVLHYLDSDPAADEWNPDDPAARILPEPLDLTADEAADRAHPSLWLELIEARNDDATRGAGTLALTGSSTTVTTSDDGWELSSRDVGRGLFLPDGTYSVASVAADDPHTFELDRSYEGEDESQALYGTGSVPFGAAWTVTLPTRLTILRENASELA